MTEQILNTPTIDELKSARVHIGHTKKYSNPRTIKLYGNNTIGKFHIINCQHTIKGLSAALRFCAQIVQNKGNIMVVSSKKQHKSLVADYCNRCNMPYLNKKWIGGLLTNFEQVRLSIKRLKNSARTDDSYDASSYKSPMTKKEHAIQERKLSHTRELFGGLIHLNRLPEAVFTLSASRNHNALLECKRMGIPTISIVDTNSSTQYVTYPIPGNDDHCKSIELYLLRFASTITSNKMVPEITEE